MWIVGADRKTWYSANGSGGHAHEHAHDHSRIILWDGINVDTSGNHSFQYRSELQDISFITPEEVASHHFFRQVLVVFSLVTFVFFIAFSIIIAARSSFFNVKKCDTLADNNTGTGDSGDDECRPIYVYRIVHQNCICMAEQPNQKVKHNSKPTKRIDLNKQINAKKVQLQVASSSTEEKNFSTNIPCGYEKCITLNPHLHHI